MAIKGKSKRSQGRTVRRVTPGPRPQFIDRRGPWYREPVFLVSLAVVALAVTAVVAASRVQEAWARDDVFRFTKALQAPVGRLTTITGTGSSGEPGFASVADLQTGKLKPADLRKRVEGWQTDLGALSDQVDKVTVGEADVAASTKGVPSNEVGGRVASLTGIKDTYVAGIASYTDAAGAFGLAAGAPKGKSQQDLIQMGQSLVQRGAATVDAAAEQLALMRSRYDLDVKAQMPGESSSAHATRTGSASSQVPGLPGQPQQPGLPGQPQQPGQPVPGDPQQPSQPGQPQQPGQQPPG